MKLYLFTNLKEYHTQVLRSYRTSVFFGITTLQRNFPTVYFIRSDDNCYF